MTSLFESDHIRVVLNQRGSDNLVVVFGHHHPDEEKFIPNHIIRHLNVAHISTIDIQNKQNHWFQVPEMPQVIAIVKAIIAGYAPKSLLTTGGSMGGFGALYYAKQLGAQRSFTFSPQSDLWLAEETRWKVNSTKWPRIYPPMTEELTDECEYIAVCDPKEKLDVMQLSHIPQVKILELNNCGHRTTPMVFELAHLDRMIISFAQDESLETIKKEMHLARAVGRRFSSAYMGNGLLKMSQRRKHKWVARIFEHIRQENYISVKDIAPRDFVTYMRAATNSKVTWFVEYLISHQGEVMRNNALKQAYIKYLTENGYPDFAKQIEGELVT